MSKAVTPITHRAVWALAGPMIISNISVPLVGAVDTAVVGRLPGPEYIGGVALGALIFSFIYWGFSFLRMGTTGYVARAKGAGDDQEMTLLLLRVLFLALLCGGIMILLGQPIIHFALFIIESSDQVEGLAAEYSSIRIWSAPATLLTYVFTGIFIGLHNTRHAFLLQIVLNLINVVLDLVFVPWLEFGVSGVAWATLIAEYVAAGLGFWLLRQRIRMALTHPDWVAVFSPGPMVKLMRTNSHIFVRTLCLVFAFALFTAQGAKLGEMILAANTILLHLHSVMAYGLDGFAHAAEALTGSAYGAGSRAQFKKAVNLTTWWAGITAVISVFLYLAFGQQLIGLFTNQQNVLSLATNFLPWIIISPLISVWSFQLDGVFIGVGHTREMQNAMLFSTFLYLGLIWLFLPLMGNHGLFFALTLFMIIRALTLWYYLPDITRAIPESSTNE